MPRASINNVSKAVVAEFVGTMLLQLFVAAAGSTAAAYAVSYAALVYMTQKYSGGHLNPAVSFTAFLTGHLRWTWVIYYILAQTVGAILGSTLEVLLIPGVHFGAAGHSPDCFKPTSHVTFARLWAWETLLTVVLIGVYYTTHFHRSGSDVSSPLAIGLAVFALSQAGGEYTLAPLNPARVFAGSIVFWCNFKFLVFYLLAHFTASIVAALFAIFMVGAGPHFAGEPGTGERASLLQGLLHDWVPAEEDIEVAQGERAAIESSNVPRAPGETVVVRQTFTT